MTNALKIKRSAVPGKIPTVAQLPAGELALNTTDEKLYFGTGLAVHEVARSTDILPIVAAVTNDASGFPNRTDTQLLFDKVNRVVSLIPVNENACIYHLGKKYPITETLSCTWSNTDQGRYIHFDPTTQTLVEGGPTPSIRTGQVLVAYVYWNVATQNMVLGGDERHGAYRDTQWHYTQHRDVGGVWRSGGSLTFTLDDPTNIKIGVSGPVVFADEDLEHTVTHDPAPNYPLTHYTQVLFPYAQLSIVAIEGTINNEYPPDTVNSIPFKHGPNRIMYNPIVNGVGSVEEVPSGKYINYWMVVTNDTEYPIKMIMGRQLFDTLDDTANGSLETYGLPFNEMAVMYRIALHVSDTYTANPCRAVIKKVVNAYRSTIGGVTAISANSHDALAARELPDQHPIAAITGLQLALDSKSASSHSHVLDALSDVIITSPQAGQTLTFNGLNWINLGAPGANGGGAAKRIWSNNVPSSTGTSIITPGTTAPLVTDGTQLWSLTLTPFATNARYVIQSSIMASGTSNNSFITLALFRDNVYIGGTMQIVQSSNNSATLSFSLTDIPNTGAPIVYQARIGISTGQWYVNRRGVENTFGGLNTGWVIWEY